ncbi:MAG: hypothetical protein QMD43_03035 [Thermodesulfovibrio sp.]|uniref:hypothetical protein n=1 Tax=Thermodesulfovibrio sp. N1 TaxID=1871110 RepID=UPI00083B1CB4|nr:hypothetical protein [Thermodesulfovibrio sp. N1]MDI6713988.1 hypothetical protein [Thermodesulfovibrio sp.]ODA44999.1 hypothetical protein THER_0226 [Thermodesulfovibrio sp. N1]
MKTLEHRVESLESLLGQFIINHDIALRRLENKIDRYIEEMQKDRKASEERLQRQIEEMEKDRKAFQDEMKAFKDEMKAFKDEMIDFKRRQEEENIRKNKEWSALAKKMGTIVEDLIAPALRPTLSKYFGCEVTMEGQRIFRRKNGEDYEIDAIAGCENKIFMIEARSTPKVEDVKEIKDKGKRFFEFFPEHKDKELIIIFGSITFPENVIKYASKRNVYVLAWREWQYMDILNFDEVRRSG